MFSDIDTGGTGVSTLITSPTRVHELASSIISSALPHYLSVSKLKLPTKTIA